MLFFYAIYKNIPAIAGNCKLDKISTTNRGTTMITVTYMNVKINLSKYKKLDGRLLL